MKYTDNKINIHAARIAVNHETNINGIMIRKYAVYGKIYDVKILFRSVNSKTKNFLNSIFTSDQLKYIYWCVENKAELYVNTNKTISIKITCKSCDRFYIVWIYQNSPMLKYIREAAKPLIDDENYNKPCNKIYTTGGLILSQEREKRNKFKREKRYYNDLGYTYSYHISNVIPKQVV